MPCRQFLKPTTMSKAEQAADDLIKQYAYSNKVPNLKKAIHCALIDNQNTIDALEAIPDLKVVGNILLDMIEHYQEVQTILKSKLK